MLYVSIRRLQLLTLIGVSAAFFVAISVTFGENPLLGYGINPYRH